jgi:hypothetical protein
MSMSVLVEMTIVTNNYSKVTFAHSNLSNSVLVEKMRQILSKWVGLCPNWPDFMGERNF